MFGQRLKLARKRAGLSMRRLADLMDPKVTAQAISKYEAGKMMPSSAILVGLGKALDVSLDFLMGGQVGKLERLEFRKHAGTLARDRARAEAIVIDSLENYFAVEEILGIKQPGDAFSDIRCDYIASEDEIDAKADELRGAWDLGMDPIPSMCALLEEKGLHVIEADLPENINGLTCHALRTRADAPETEVIVVSSRSNVERKRLTLAHELAHRIIQSTGNPAIKLESAMNRFAGAFLVPGEHLVKEVGSRRHRITYYEIIRLKQIYGVSAAALLLRLGQVGVLPGSVVQRAFSTFARAWRKIEPEPIRDNEGFGAFEKPSRFKSLVWRAVGEELISPIRAAQFLHQSLEDIESRIRGPIGTTFLTSAGTEIVEVRIRDLLLRLYDRPVMNNVHRAQFVECLIALALGDEWQLTWQQGWDWAAWDLESQSGIRLEVKQSAQKQAWDRPSQTPQRNPRFDIAPRKGYWTREGSHWVDSPGRPADLYVFAWHGERRSALCDQRDAEQWLFFVVREQDLPREQKSIGLKAIEELVAPCQVGELKSAIAGVCSVPEASKPAEDMHNMAQS